MSCSKMIANIIILGILAILYIFVNSIDEFISNKQTKSHFEKVLIRITIALLFITIEAPLFQNLSEAAVNFAETQKENLTKNINQILFESDNSPIPSDVTGNDNDPIPSDVTGSDNGPIPSGITD